MRYQLKIATGNWTDAATYGVADIERCCRHAGEDTLTLTLTGQTISTDALLAWAYGTAISLRRTDDNGSNPELLFAGTLSNLTRAATGASESVVVTVSGPWAILEKTVYRQEWMEPDSDTTPTAATSVYVPRAVLFRGWNSTTHAETRVDTIHQILDALNLAAESSPDSFTVPEEGTGEGEVEYPDGFYPPYDEQMNITCAEVIRRALSMHPNLCLWFDYSTSPPTVCLQTRADLAVEADFALSDLESVQVTRRDDLIPPAVCLAYIKTGTYNGKTYTFTQFDMAGPAGLTPQQIKALMYSPGTLWGVYEMEGPTQEYVEQTCKVKRINWASNKSNGDFWKTYCPEVAGYTLTNFANQTISGNVIGNDSLDNFLLEGAVQSWQKKKVATATFTATATATRYGSNGVQQEAQEVKEVTLTFTATVTNLGGTIGDDYIHEITDRKQVGFDSGEDVPLGFADALYDEWSVPQYEGSVTVHAQEAPSGHTPGELLNISDGVTEWATMDALVTEVRESFTGGTLAISFGTGGWIDLDSRVAWLRACKSRRYSWQRQLKDEGADNGDGAIGIDGVPGGDGGSPDTALHKLVVTKSGSPADGIELDPSAMTGRISPQPLRTASGIGWVLASLPIDTNNYCVRYDPATHQLQESTDGGDTWTMIDGGQAVAYTEVIS